VQGALARAKELNIRISVAVLDAADAWSRSNRMDGALWAAPTARREGDAVDAFARPSGELQERAGSPIIQGIAAAEGVTLIPSQGSPDHRNRRRRRRCARRRHRAAGRGLRARGRGQL